MPAVTVDDLLVLPRISAPVGAIQRPVISVTRAPAGFEGEGFPVLRAFAGVDLALLDPFIHLDEMGEVDYAAGEPKGTPWHPHRGFETVTYMIDGMLRHADSHGGGGLISDGATQWMTAGSGLLHIETPPEEVVMSGGLFHGLQLWVNLPKAQKMVAPRYQDLTAEQVKLASSADGGALVRLIAGDLTTSDGTVLVGPGSTRTPITMAHLTLTPGASIQVPWRRDFNALAYVLSGEGAVGPDAGSPTDLRPAAASVRSGMLTVLGAGDVLTVAAAPKQESRHPALEVVLLGGLPIKEPVAWQGPFVMNTRDELLTAFDDFRAGRLGSIPVAG